MRSVLENIHLIFYLFDELSAIYSLCRLAITSCFPSIASCWTKALRNIAISNMSMFDGAAW